VLVFYRYTAVSAWFERQPRDPNARPRTVHRDDHTTESPTNRRPLAHWIARVRGITVEEASVVVRGSAATQFAHVFAEDTTLSPADFHVLEMDMSARDLEQRLSPAGEQWFKGQVQSLALVPCTWSGGYGGKNKGLVRYMRWSEVSAAMLRNESMRDCVSAFFDALDEQDKGGGQDKRARAVDDDDNPFAQLLANGGGGGRGRGGSFDGLHDWD
jgi:hypothetical protein